MDCRPTPEELQKEYDNEVMFNLAYKPFSNFVFRSSICTVTYNIDGVSVIRNTIDKGKFAKLIAAFVDSVKAEEVIEKL